MKRYNQILLLMAVLVLPLSGLSCSVVWRAEFSGKEPPLASEPEGSTFLKAHKENGDVLVFSEWHVEEQDGQPQRLTGKGIEYTYSREPIVQGELSIPLSDVALIETNKPESVIRYDLVLMGVASAGSVATSIYCMANPKACFGSCPTFYADGASSYILAEGFSSSVAKRLEAPDIDALYSAPPPSSDIYSLVMRNEALETHVIRSVELMSVPRPEGGRVFQGRDGFYPARNIRSPLSCEGIAGNCLEAVNAPDEEDYLSPTDGQDLATRETIALSFPASGGRSGLVIGARASLLVTYLGYQMMAYISDEPGRWLMRLEQGSYGADSTRAITSLLGGIDVSVLNNAGEWVAVDTYDEHGPLAREVQVFPLPNDLPPGDVQVRLSVTRGYYKIDYLALANIDDPVEPTFHPLTAVTRDGQESMKALRLLLDPEAHLVTYPGDRYTLHFDLSDLEGVNPEFFLRSHGYYYEWSRERWKEEQDTDAFLEFMADPREGLKTYAPAYKAVEDEIERVFWNSRIRRDP